MRKRAGSFSDNEYWSHSDTGGHPAPKGARLLEKFDPAGEVWPYSAERLMIDLGQHLRRLRRATDKVLSIHHPRYTRVRARQQEQTKEAWTDWQNADPVPAMLGTLD
jgi:hypothetical protein